MDSNLHTTDFEALFSFATVGILAIDSAGIITMVNPFLLAQFGYDDPAELKGKKVEILIPEHLRVRHIVHRDHYIQHPQNRPMGLGMDLLGLKKDGTQFPVEISLSHYVRNGVASSFAFITDISQRRDIQQRIIELHDELQHVAVELEERVTVKTRQLSETIQQLEAQVNETESAKSKLMKSEEELKVSLEKEKELSELKSRFLSTASHEFRTPLSSILSSIYLLSKYTTTEDQPRRDKHIQRIISSVTLLTEILNDFLSVSKIEEGKIEVNWKEFDLDEHIVNLIADMQTIVKTGQHFSYRYEGEKRVTLDSTLLKHILINLMSNAIKFSPEDAVIELCVRVNKESVSLSVKDQGIGIDPDDQRHLFERFYRASNAIHIQGTGLGLHIVEKYVSMMGGNIRCKSARGNGTEFIVNFATRH